MRGSAPLGDAVGLLAMLIEMRADDVATAETPGAGHGAARGADRVAALRRLTQPRCRRILVSTRWEPPMTELPDHEFEVLEDDETVPPRPEELVADAIEEPAPESSG
jgi:hypothetical protein